MLLTTDDALFENQMWKRLVHAGASSALDTWMGTKSQDCFSNSVKPRNSACPRLTRPSRSGNKGKRTFESHTRTEDSEISASGTGESSDTYSIYLKYRQS